MRILMLGATGVAGRSTLPVLVEGGHDVTALARNPQAEAWIRATGATPVTGDSDDPATLREWLEGVDTAIDLRVHLPMSYKALFPSTWREYRRVRDTAAGTLVDAAIAVGTPKVVHDTITMVYADGGNRWVTEDSQVAAVGPAKANLACEDHMARLTQAGGTGVALRMAMFYGPDDDATRALVKQARSGRTLWAGPAKAWHSAIHTADVGPAVAAAATRHIPPGVYNVGDDEPLRYGELRAILARSVHQDRVTPPPLWLLRHGPGATLVRSQRVSTARFREATGWAPTVPSRRTGLPEAVAAYS